VEKSFENRRLEDREDLKDGINIDKSGTGSKTLKEMHLLPMAIYIVSNARSQGSATRQFNSVLWKTELRMLGAVVAIRERDRSILSARDPLINSGYRFSHSERICRPIIQMPALPGVKCITLFAMLSVHLSLFRYLPICFINLSNYWSRRF
jgi:hypothetical protein